MRLLEAKHLDAIDTHLDLLLGRLLESDDLGEFRDAIRCYVMRGGKRIRPQLTIWTYLHCGEVLADGLASRPVGLVDASAGFADPKVIAYRSVAPSVSGSFVDRSGLPLPRPLLDMACAWELFHAFLLIHDDIIDGSDLRRDQPALHRQLQCLDSNSPRFGMNLGIVAGDLLFSATMRLWADLDLPGSMYRRALRMFTRVATTTGFGQAIDIVQSHVPLAHVAESTLLREYHWKTAAYTFEGPMLSAAIFAGLDDAAGEAISTFSLALGQAYQLQNDLIDLAREAAEGCDLVEAKRTVTLMRARAGLADGQRTDFDRRLREIEQGAGASLQLAEQFRLDLIERGAAQETRVLIDEFLDTARAAAADPALPPELGTATSALLDALTAQYFVVR